MSGDIRYLPASFVRRGESVLSHCLPGGRAASGETATRVPVDGGAPRNPSGQARQERPLGRAVRSLAIVVGDLGPV